MIGLFHCPARSIQKFVLMAKMSLEENFGGKCWFLRDFGGKQATNGERRTQRRQLHSRTR